MWKSRFPNCPIFWHYRTFSLHYPSISFTHSSSFSYSYSLFYGSSRIWRDRSVICSLSERVVEHIWQGFHKNKQNPRYIYRVFDLLSLQVKSYESKLSPPIRHTFYWCSKLHCAHNRAINIKNIRQITIYGIWYRL